MYRDTELERDELSRLFVQSLPQHLTDGGMATLLACWFHGKNEEWSAPVRRWLAGSGCDALVLRYVGDDPISYATKWTADEDDTDRWLTHFEEQGIEHFATGALVLRTSRRERFVAHKVAGVPVGSSTDQLLRMFAALDFDGDLFDERLALAPHRLHEQLACTSAGYAPEYLTLILDEGAGIEAAVDVAALQTLVVLDGSRPLQELPGADVALPAIRRLVELGFLERRL